MDSSNYNEYRNFISSLSEDNFNDLVLSYIKEYYNTKDAYISNGPYDGGNDLIIAVDGKEIKRNIQITVQSKELPKKIIEDVIKAHAEARSESVNGFINRAIEETMERDKAAPAASEGGEKPRA